MEMIPRELKLERWGPGPWIDEPDFARWDRGDIGCLVLRHLEIGSLNGYVRLPRGHPWRGMDYHQIPAQVHGGITFAGLFPFEGAGRGPLAWWIGFDCFHGGTRDGVPMFKIPGTTYRTFDYARAETESLAMQVAAAVKRLGKGDG